MERSWIDHQQFNQSIDKINSIIAPFKQRLASNERQMYLYLLLGLFLFLALSILLGIVAHFALALVMIALYLCGLVYIIKKFQRENAQLLK